MLCHQEKSEAARCAPPSRFRSLGSSTDAIYEKPDLAKWLVVFENADHPEILFKYCWPRNDHGSILVTSRNPTARNSLYFGKAGYEVAPLSDGAAGAFLMQITDRDDMTNDRETAETIAKRLGGLPLAIEQTGAFISLSNMSLQRFWSVYKNDKDIEALQDQQYAEGRGYKYNLAGVFALGKLPLDSRAVLNVMAFLDSDRIHGHLLTDDPSSMQMDFYPQNQIGLLTAIDTLRKCSLISGDIDYIELRVHRLVQDVARAQMGETGVLETCFDAVVNLVWAHFPRITRGGVGRAPKIDKWQQCDQLFPHISRLCEFYEAYTGDKKVFKSQRKFADLLNEAGWYQLERSNPTATTPIVELAQRICERSGEDYTEQLALIYATRTWSCALMKQFHKAFIFAQDRLELEQKLCEIKGSATANLASAYNDKVAAYSMNELPASAFSLLEKSQRLCELMKGFKPEYDFSPYHERGVAYWLLGEYEESAKCLLKALRDRIAAFGENDRQSVRTGQLFYALGNTLASQARQSSDAKLWADSAMWHHKALVHYRATAGDKHYRTADMLGQAIDVFKDQSCYQQEHARACFLGRELYKIEGNTAAAQDMLQKSIESWNKTFPQMPVTGEDLRKEDFESLFTYDF